MTPLCPTRDDWLRHLDGEVTANRARSLAAHAARCAACRREADALAALARALRAPVAGDPAALAARVVARLDEPPPSRGRRWLAARGADRAQASTPPARVGGPAHRRRLVRWAAFAAACAVVVVLATLPRDGELASRGRAGHAFGRPVAVAIHALGRTLEPLADGARVAPSTAYVASYRNPGAAPVFALVFAIDAARDVHWLYPAFTDPATDPRSLALAPAVAPRLLDETVVFDHPARGRMAIVALLTRTPLHVSDIESLAWADRTVAALRLRWPDADVRAIAVQVD